MGVAVVIAIDIANDSARRAFLLSTSTVTGRATDQLIGGPNGIDEAFFAQLRVDQGIRTSAPVVPAGRRRITPAGCICGSMVCTASESMPSTSTLASTAG